MQLVTIMTSLAVSIDCVLLRPHYPRRSSKIRDFRFLKFVKIREFKQNKIRKDLSGHFEAIFDCCSGAVP